MVGTGCHRGFKDEESIFWHDRGREEEGARVILTRSVNRCILVLARISKFM